MSTNPSAQRRSVVVAAVLGVAAAVVGVSVLQGVGSEPASPPRATPTVLGEQVMVLDLGEVPAGEARDACGTPAFSAGGVDVRYAVRQATEEGDVPVVLLANAEGELRMCDVAGPDHPAQFPVPTASDAEPVVSLAGRASWECTGTRLDRYTSTSWLAVDDAVDRVEQRFVVDGVAGPWFSTKASGGYAHLQAWETGPLPQGTSLVVEHRVLDAEGEPVAQGHLPVGPTELGRCEDGDVQIG